MESLAEEAGWDLNATRILLGLLESEGLVNIANEYVSLTDNCHKWFGAGSPYNFSPYFSRLLSLRESFSRLDIVLKKGKPDPSMRELTRAAFGGESNATETFASTMAISALEFGPSVVEELLKVVPSMRPARMLDVGCGPGTFDFIISKTYPRAYLTAFDLPRVIEVAQHHLNGNQRQSSFYCSELE